MDFENIFLPHIMYVSDPNGERVGLYYLGGEPEENARRLTVGKIYYLNTRLYSPSRDIERVRVWSTEDDENKGKLCRINLSNFGNLADLRNKKIETIIDGSDLS